jgi:hypothetical protein
MFFFFFSANGLILETGGVMHAKRRRMGSNAFGFGCSCFRRNLGGRGSPFFFGY